MWKEVGERSARHAKLRDSAYRIIRKTASVIILAGLGHHRRGCAGSPQAMMSKLQDQLGNTAVGENHIVRAKIHRSSSGGRFLGLSLLLQ